jgi:hypothetical protein
MLPNLPKIERASLFLHHLWHGHHSVSIANFNGSNVDYVLTYWVDDAAKMGKVNADMRLMLLKAFENDEIPVAAPAA